MCTVAKNNVLKCNICFSLKALGTFRKYAILPDLPFENIFLKHFASILLSQVHFAKKIYLLSGALFLNTRHLFFSTANQPNEAFAFFKCICRFGFYIKIGFNGLPVKFDSKRQISNTASTISLYQDILLFRSL